MTSMLDYNSIGFTFTYQSRIARNLGSKNIYINFTFEKLHYVLVMV